MSRPDRIALAMAIALVSTAASILLPAAPAGAQSADSTPLHPPSEFAQVSGEVVYRAICQGCHMPDGEGAVGAGDYPALIDNPRLAAAPYVAMIVLDGRGGMPPFGDMLDDRQVAEVATYVRTHFGNAYTEPVTADEVEQIRQW